MKYLLLFLSCILLLTSCETTKNLAMTDGSKSDGILTFHYDVGSFEKPIVQWDSALIEAKATCKRWGYSNAEWFGTGTSTCVQYNQYGCIKTRYTHKCMCID